MKQKSMLKFVLSALLLAGSASAFADGEETTTGGPVTLGDAAGTTTTWGEFAKAVNNRQGTIDAAVSSAKTRLTTAQTTEEILRETTVPNALAEYNRLNKVYNTKTPAEGEEGVKDPKDYTGPTELERLETLYNVASDTLQQRINKRDNMAEEEKYEQTPIGWLKDIYTDAQNYLDKWINYLSNNTVNPQIDLYYRLITNTVFGQTTNTIYLSFEKPDSFDETSLNWKKVTSIEAFGGVLYPSDTAISITVAYVYLGKGRKDATGKDVPSELTITQLGSSNMSLIQDACNELTTLTKTKGYYQLVATTKYQTLLDNITAATTEKNTAFNNWQNAQKSIDNAYSTYTKAQNDLAAAQSELTAAQNAYNQAVTNANTDFDTKYGTITLTGDITATTTITSYNGTINGGDHIMTLGAGATSFFGTFGGTLYEAAVNGKFANGKTNNTRYQDVAYVDLSTSTPIYRYYNDDAASKDYTTIGELGYAARGEFGVDLLNSKLVSLDDNSLGYSPRVYNVTIYNYGNTVSGYVNEKYDEKGVATGVFVNKQYPNGIKAENANTFIKTMSEDLSERTNYIYNDVCINAIITDKVPFYAPFDIQTSNLTYGRELKARFNSICVPFELDATMGGDNIEFLCTYDTETPSQFWFTHHADGKVAANTPVLIQAKEGIDNFTLSIPTSTTIKQTMKQINDLNSQNDGKSYGMLKKVSAAEILGASQVTRVYGLVGNTFQPAEQTASFNPFRMAVTSDLPVQSGAPRRIGIRDERGIILFDGETDAIESVESDAASFDVTTGVGEIIFTSEADFGKVEVYSLDGRVAAVADVMAGTTSVNVAKGVYIVMGKKVMVK